jgi:hypothetical protein
MVLNRLNSDGAIANFAKDGTTVGSIGVAQSGDRTYFSGGSYGIASDTSETTIMPCGTTGTGNDGVLNLGKADARFKDLYLSGGVYLGGTGSANKLDDYESGSFTPNINFGGGATGIAYGNRGGRYVKIGNFVFVRVGIRLTNKGSSTGGLRITGFPFAAESIAYSDATGATSFAGMSLPNDSGMTMIMDNGQSRARLVYFNTAGEYEVNNSHVNNSSYFYATICYSIA